MTIALFKFGHVGWPADQWTLPTYYLAQGLIAFCVLPRSRPDNPALLRHEAGNGSGER